MKFACVLLDTVGIQKYIFTSNKLKENLGASYLVDEIYNDLLKDTIEEIIPNVDSSIFKDWKKKPEDMPITSNKTDFEIGYIGGGNALLFFKNKDLAEKFLHRWSIKVFVNAPGIVVTSAMKDIDINGSKDERFQELIADLYVQLAKNKNKYFPRTVLPRHGITAECARTGYSMEVWCDKLPDDEKGYVSSVANAKIMAAEKTKKKMEEMFLNRYGQKYLFPDSLENLGQKPDEENFIAIVHIDGNEMGERFKEKKSLYEKRKLSVDLKKAVESSFSKVLDKIHEDFNEIRSEFNIKSEENKFYLPIRPIIIGGDDVTFVTAGRLGIYLTKVFLENFEKQKIFDNKPISACGGIAIIKTKYPFYRGYQICEELSSFAKDKRIYEKSNGSWFDFQLVKGSVIGEIDILREKDYKVSERSLYMRPYNLEEFDQLLRAGKEFIKNFPRNKLMKLREVLYMDESSIKYFISEIKSRKLKLLNWRDFDKKLFINNKTPYLDLIEIFEFYPKYVLKKEELNDIN